jgi:hypothetical protein
VECIIERLVAPVATADKLAVGSASQVDDQTKDDEADEGDHFDWGSVLRFCIADETGGIRDLDALHAKTNSISPKLNVSVRSR